MAREDDKLKKDFDNLDDDFGDDADLDSEFEDMFNDDSNTSDVEEPPKNKREAVSRATKKIYNSTKDNLKSTSILKFAGDTFRSGLSNEGKEAYSELRNELGTFRDELSKTLKPFTNTLGNVAETLANKTKNTKFQKTSKLLDSIANKFKESNTTMFEETKESIDSFKEEINSSLLDIENKIEIGKATGKSSIITNKYLDKQVRLTAIMKEQDRLFYNKSLEMQWKMNFTLSEQLKLQRESYESYTKLLENIIHNTALPEAVKLQNNELAIQTFKQKVYGGLSETIYKKLSPLKDIRSNIINGLTNKIYDISDQIEMFKGLRDNANDLKEYGISKEELVGSQVANVVRSLISKGVIKLVPGKSRSMVSGNLRAFMFNPVDYLKTKRFKDVFQSGPIGKLKNLANAGIDYLDYTSSASRNTIRLGKFNPEEPAVFDGKTHNIINTIIPGYLAKIHNEIHAFRTGTDLREDNELRYNSKTNRFDTKGRIRSDLRKDLQDNYLKYAKERADNMAKMISETLKDVKITNKDKVLKPLSKSILNYLTKYGSISPEALTDIKFIREYDYTLQDSATLLFKEYNKLLRSGKDTATQYYTFKYASNVLAAPTRLLNRNLSNNSDLLSELNLLDVTDSGIYVNNEGLGNLYNTGLRTGTKVRTSNRPNYNRRRSNYRRQNKSKAKQRLYEEYRRAVNNLDEVGNGTTDYIDAEVVDENKGIFNKENIFSNIKDTVKDSSTFSKSKETIDDIKNDIKDTIKETIDNKEDILNKGKSFYNNTKDKSEEFVNNIKEDINLKETPNIGREEISLLKTRLTNLLKSLLSPFDFRKAMKKLSLSKIFLAKTRQKMEAILKSSIKKSYLDKVIYHAYNAIYKDNESINWLVNNVKKYGNKAKENILEGYGFVKDNANILKNKIMEKHGSEYFGNIKDMSLNGIANVKDMLKFKSPLRTGLKKFWEFSKKTRAKERKFYGNLLKKLGRGIIKLPINIGKFGLGFTDFWTNEGLGLLDRKLNTNLANKYYNLKDGISNLFKKAKPNTKEDVKEKAGKAQDGVLNTFKKAVNTFAKSTGYDPDRRKNDYIQRLDEEKKKKEEEKNALREASKEKGSFLGGLWGKIKSFGKFAIPFLITKLLGGIKRTGKILHTVGTTLVKYVPKIAKGIWNTGKYVVKIGKGLFKYIKPIAKALWAILGRMGKFGSMLLGKGMSTKLGKGILAAGKAGGKLIGKGVASAAAVGAKLASTKLGTAVIKGGGKVAKLAGKAAGSSIIKKIIGTLKSFGSLLIKRLGKRAGGKMVAKLTAKIASRGIPFVGQALLVADAALAVKYMTIDKLSLKSAICKAVLGFDLFNEDEPIVDENGEPIHPDDPADEEVKKVNDIKEELEQEQTTDSNNKNNIDKPGINKSKFVNEDLMEGLPKSTPEEKDFNKTKNNYFKAIGIKGYGLESDKSGNQYWNGVKTTSDEINNRKYYINGKEVTANDFYNNNIVGVRSRGNPIDMENRLKAEMEDAKAKGIFKDNSVIENKTIGLSSDFEKQNNLKSTNVLEYKEGSTNFTLDTNDKDLKDNRSRFLESLKALKEGERDVRLTLKINGETYPYGSIVENEYYSLGGPEYDNTYWRYTKEGLSVYHYDTGVFSSTKKLRELSIYKQIKRLVDNNPDYLQAVTGYDKSTLSKMPLIKIQEKYIEYLKTKIKSIQDAIIKKSDTQEKGNKGIMDLLVKLFTRSKEALTGVFSNKTGQKITNNIRDNSGNVNIRQPNYRGSGGGSGTFTPPKPSYDVKKKILDPIIQRLKTLNWSPEEKAGFLANLHVETGGFKAFIERISKERADRNYYGVIGNYKPDDGSRFLGRGPIQLTGRENYRRVGELIGVDLENNPDLVATDPDIGVASAFGYWELRKKMFKSFRNAIANKDIVGMSYGVNGGYNGLPQRQAAYPKYLELVNNDKLDSLGSQGAFTEANSELNTNINTSGDMSNTNFTTPTSSGGSNNGGNVTNNSFTNMSNLSTNDYPIGIDNKGNMANINSGITTSLSGSSKAEKAAIIATRRAAKNGTTSAHQCGTYVFDALRDAGYKDFAKPVLDGGARTHSAGDSASTIGKAGFTQISLDSEYKPGDVMIFPKRRSSNSKLDVEHGHIQIWNGKNFVSDFMQTTPGCQTRPFNSPGNKYRGIVPTLWRDLGENTASELAKNTKEDETYEGGVDNKTKDSTTDNTLAGGTFKDSIFNTDDSTTGQPMGTSTVFPTPTTEQVNNPLTNNVASNNSQPTQNLSSSSVSNYTPVTGSNNTEMLKIDSVIDVSNNVEKGNEIASNQLTELQSIVTLLKELTGNQDALTQKNKADELASTRVQNTREVSPNRIQKPVPSTTNSKTNLTNNSLRPEPVITGR